LSRARSVLREVWPRLAAIAILVAIWQLVYQSGFFDKVVLP